MSKRYVFESVRGIRQCTTDDPLPREFNFPPGDGGVLRFTIENGVMRTFGPVDYDDRIAPKPVDEIALDDEFVSDLKQMFGRMIDNPTRVVVGQRLVTPPTTNDK
tara:strand:+ start:1906 stop:2220 length:315 start_codon:yes stop_codon:yes gene_type:complete